MDKKVEAITKELTRVREIKRNLISTVEFLRSEMEAGRIHLRVNVDKIRRYRLNLDSNSFDYIDPLTGETSTVKKSWRFLLFSELIDDDGEIKDEIIVEIKP